MRTKYQPVPLTPAQIAIAKERRSRGDKLKDIAQELGRSEGAVSRLCRGKTFRVPAQQNAPTTAGEGAS